MMCSVATKETPRKRRSTRLSQSSDDPINGNGVESSSMGEQTEDDETTTTNTPQKRTRTNSVRKSTRKTRLNGNVVDLINGTIDEVDELEADTVEKKPNIEKSPIKQKKRKQQKQEEEEEEDDDDENDVTIVEKKEEENHLESNHQHKSKVTEQLEVSSTAIVSSSSSSSTHPQQQSFTQLSTSEPMLSSQLPRSDCLTNILVQALQSGDESKLMQIINRNQESIMINTLRSLPQEYVEPLFQTLSRLLHKNGTNQFYISWMRKLFQCKISHIVNLPEIRNQLLLLSDTLDIRCDLLERCFKLKGRLDLMLSLVENEVKAPQKENIILYEESSSESDNDMDGEEGDNLMHLLNSDDDDEEDEEQQQTAANAADLDDDEVEDLEDAMFED